MKKEARKIFRKEEKGKVLKKKKKRKERGNED